MLEQTEAGKLATVDVLRFGNAMSELRFFTVEQRFALLDEMVREAPNYLPALKKIDHISTGSSLA